MPRVLFDTREKHFHQNPYIADLVTSVDDVQIDGFSWRRALFGRYDVVHIHWPEWLVKHRQPAVGMAMRLLLSVALVRWRIGRVRILRTMHNRKPHAAVTPWGQKLMEAIERRSDRRIWLSSMDGDAMEAGDAVIPHPDYEPLRRRLAIEISDPPTASVGLCFGSIAPYRRFDEVAQAASDSTGQLAIAGSAVDETYASVLEGIAARSSGRVRVMRGRLDDLALAELISDSDVVFVPYDDLYNSGVVFLSLTLQRPVALRASATAAMLSAEYGDTWIRQWDGKLDSATFEKIVNTPAPAGRAHSARRDWAAIGSAHQRVYVEMSR